MKKTIVLKINLELIYCFYVPNKLTKRIETVNLARLRRASYS